MRTGTKRCQTWTTVWIVAFGLIHDSTECFRKKVGEKRYGIRSMKTWRVFILILRIHIHKIFVIEIQTWNRHVLAEVWRRLNDAFWTRRNILIRNESFDVQTGLPCSFRFRSICQFRWSDPRYWTESYWGSHSFSAFSCWTTNHRITVAPINSRIWIWTDWGRHFKLICVFYCEYLERVE